MNITSFFEALNSPFSHPWRPFLPSMRVEGERSPLLLLSQERAAMVENLCQIGHCLGPQHGDTRLSEVGYSLEDGRSRQMAACV